MVARHFDVLKDAYGQMLLAVKFWDFTAGAKQGEVQRLSPHSGN